jgi:hypothetical protein
MLGQMLKLIPRTEFAQVVKQTRAERHPISAGESRQGAA